MLPAAVPNWPHGGWFCRAHLFCRAVDSLALTQACYTPPASNCPRATSMFVLPINQDKVPAGKPRATYALIVLNCALWLGPTILGLNSHFIQTYGYRPASPSVLTVFASMFLHVGFLHVAGNM